MSNEDIQAQVRSHMIIFGGVLALTIIGVGLTLTLGGLPIPAIMGIAAVQGILIMAFLMHVKSEAKTVQCLLAFCAFFVIMLFVLMIGTIADPLNGTESIAPVATVEEAAAEEH